MYELILILQQFGGGKGGEPGNIAVRFLLAAAFWSFLAIIAHKEWRKTRQPRDLYVAFAALLGIFRELLMFTAEYGSYRDRISFDAIYRYYPPLEHALTMLSGIVIAFAFLRHVQADRQLTNRFLRYATLTTLLIYMVTALDWPSFLAAHPRISFGRYGGDLVFRVTASLIMGTALGVFLQVRRKGNHVSLALLGGFCFLFLDEFLMIANIVTLERNVELYASIRHNLHIWAIPLLTGTYFSDLRVRADEALQFIHEEVETRRTVEEELRRNKARLLESQRVAHIGHFELDLNSGNWNNSEELNNIFGIDAGFCRDMERWLMIAHPEEREELVSFLQRQVQQKCRSFTREYRIRRISDQVERWVHGICQLEFASDGSLQKLFGTIQDITDRKRAEEEHLNLEGQILHAQKLESLGVLAGGIAHDFNNILMAILGHAELAHTSLNPASPALDNLRKIKQAALRAADLTRQMLAYSGKGKFVIESINLGDLITEMAHMLEVSISKKVLLRLDLADSLPPTEGDATQVRQVLMNLVINASESINDNNGVIAISTGAMQCDSSYLSDCLLGEHLTEGLYAFLEVTDTGCGMTRETLSKVFDPFYTTKFTGRGLGMAAVLGIVRSHRGAIEIRSEPGKGTTFKILLPAAQGRVETPSRATAPEMHWKSDAMILLVDDEEILRNLGSEMLGELGFTVMTAGNGKEGLDVFTQHQGSIAAVILDLTMPIMGGEEAFRELRSIKSDVPVIMSSGYSEQEVRPLFHGKEPVGFMQKPYTLDALRGVLRQTLETGSRIGHSPESDIQDGIPAIANG